MNLSRRITQSTRGRLSVWWWTHRHQARTVLLTTGLLASIATMQALDAYDEQHSTDLAIARAAELRRERELMEKLPLTIFILEAKTTAEAQDKLARITGDLDAERYRAWRNGK